MVKASIPEGRLRSWGKVPMASPPLNPSNTVLVAIIAVLIFLFGAVTASNADEFDQIEKTLGAKGHVQEGALLLRFPRSDISVTIRGEPVLTSLGFVSWTAWKSMGDNTLLIGDLVLLESEVNPVISALESSHVTVAALDTHFMGEQPRIMYMHIEGVGRGVKLARGIKAALSKTATPPQSGPDAPEAPIYLNTRRIEDITGHSGVNEGGVLKITVGRAGVISHGMELTSSMGLNSWAGFAGTNQHAHVAGDIAATASEVNPVIRALRAGGIDVVALHNHMLDDQPRIFFVHYWGTGRAEQLAQAVRSAFEMAQGPVR
jgi:hypothetical protein